MIFSLTGNSYERLADGANKPDGGSELIHENRQRHDSRDLENNASNFEHAALMQADGSDTDLQEQAQKSKHSSPIVNDLSGRRQYSSSLELESS